MPQVGKGLKNINIQVRPEDHEALALLAKEAGVSQGFVVRILLQMAALMAASARQSGLIPEDSRQPALESFVALVGRYMGLIGDAEFSRVWLLADAMAGKRSDMRLNGLGQLMNERLEQLRPIWEAARSERSAAEWDAARAAAAAMMDAEKAQEALQEAAQTE